MYIKLDFASAVAVPQTELGFLAVFSAQTVHKLGKVKSAGVSVMINKHNYETRAKFFIKSFDSFHFS